MSAEVQAVGFLCLLAVAAGGVTLSVLPSVGRRARQMQATQRRQETEAREVVASSSASRFEEALVASSVPAEPNYHRERPAGDTQEWEIQERVVEPEPADWVPAGVIEEEPELVEPDPVVEDEVAALFANEPTPLAPGAVPQLPPDLDPNTYGWNRAEWQRRLRRYELEQLELTRGDQAA